MIMFQKSVPSVLLPDSIALSLAHFDDAKCYTLARDIKDKIENELTYPGQIKVTVIRETRAVETAK